MSAEHAPVVIRRANREDEPKVLTLMEHALGWNPSDQDEGLFAWKHIENPFGRSPSWLAEVGDELVGFRTFMRWRFITPDGAVDAVRAVDTATAPAHQGKGIFTALTMHALDELARDGVGFVFNTPNDRSRPGYLKMGWTLVGRLPIAASVFGPKGAARMLRAHTAANRWSEPTSVGEAALDMFADTDAVEELLKTCQAGPIATERSALFLRWRYGFSPLHYRVVASPRGLSGGAAVFRLRRRGGALEATVCDVLAPTKQVGRDLVRRLLRLSRADYAISLGPSRFGVPLYGQGPLLTHRTLTVPWRPPIADWALALGDIELF